MTLIRQYRPSARIAFDELDGLLKMLDDAIAERADIGLADTLYYVGAYWALEIIRYHEFVDVPADFMLLFNSKVCQKGETENA